jgi:hypothetical protein
MLETASQIGAMREFRSWTDVAGSPIGRRNRRCKRMRARLQESRPGADDVLHVLHFGRIGSKGSQADFQKMSAHTVVWQ